MDVSHCPGQSAKPPSGHWKPPSSSSARAAAARCSVGFAPVSAERAVQVRREHQRQRARGLLLGALVRILVRGTSRFRVRPTSAVEESETLRPPAPGNAPEGRRIFRSTCDVVSPYAAVVSISVAAVTGTAISNDVGLAAERHGHLHASAAGRSSRSRRSAPARSRPARSRTCASVRRNCSTAGSRLRIVTTALPGAASVFVTTARERRAVAHAHEARERRQQRQRLRRADLALARSEARSPVVRRSP